MTSSGWGDSVESKALTRKVNTEGGKVNMEKVIIPRDFEMKILKYYESLRSRDGSDWEPENYQKAVAIVKTLTLLEYKIKGINE